MADSVTMRRWWIVGPIAFLAMMVNQMERGVITIALPSIMHTMNINLLEASALISAFSLGYFPAQPIGGWIVDKLKPRKALSSFLAGWGVLVFLMAAFPIYGLFFTLRILLGLLEGPGFTSTFKMYANWFPYHERGKANQFSTSGQNWAIALTPLIFGILIYYYGWQFAYEILLVPAIIMAFVVYIFWRDSPTESKYLPEEEKKYITENLATEDVTYARKKGYGLLLKNKNLWLLVLAWFSFDLLLWGTIDFLPTYLIKQKGFTILSAGIFSSIPFMVGGVFPFLTTALSDKLGTRKWIMITSGFIAAIFMVMAAYSNNPYTALIYFTLSFSFAATITPLMLTMPQDFLNREDVGLGAGLVNMGGQIAGFVIPLIVGYLATVTSSFFSGFLVMAAGAVAGAIIMIFVKEVKKISSAGQKTE